MPGLRQLYESRGGSDTYLQIALGREVWDQRSSLEEWQIKSVFESLNVLYQWGGMPKERLELNLDYFGYRQAKEDSSGYSWLYAGLGGIYHELHHFDNAFKYYNLSADAFHKEGNPLMEASLTNNIGLLYHQWQKTDSSLFFFAKALAIIDSVEDSPDLDRPSYMAHFKNVIIWNKTGALSQKEGDSLRTLMAPSLILSGSVHHEPFWVCAGLQALAMDKYRAGQFAAAISEFDSVLTLSKRWGNTHLLHDVLTYKSRAMLVLGMQAEADDLQQRARFVRDSLRKGEANEEAIVAAALFDTREREQEMLQLSLERLTAEKEVEAEKGLNKLLFLALGSIVLVLGLLALFLQKSRKDRKNIALQKSLVETSLSQKEILLKEIHHRVKNNMQVISGLLQLQASKSKNDEVKEVMKIGQGRIKSMALVHQMLYLNEDLSNIRFKDYMERLIQYSVSTQTKSAVKVTLEDNQAHLGMERAVHIGLIVNELLSNCYKHAFPTGEGHIHIKMIPLPEGQMELVVEDDGCGLPEGFNVTQSKSLGLRLVNILSEQIRASFTLSATLSGTRATLRFQHLAIEEVSA